MTQSDAPISAMLPDRTDAGILARVPGEYIAQASRSLPDPTCAIVDEIMVEVDAAWVGRVRLTFKRQRYSRPRAKSSYMAWLCRHAEALPPVAGERP